MEILFFIITRKRKSVSIYLPFHIRLEEIVRKKSHGLCSTRVRGIDVSLGIDQIVKVWHNTERQTNIIFDMQRYYS